MAQITMDNRAARYLDYVARIGVGRLVSRLQMARMMDCSYCTAVYNLERAVREGRLHKVVGFVGNQTGWLYCLPETQERLLKDGFDV